MRVGMGDPRLVLPMENTYENPPVGISRDFQLTSPGHRLMQVVVTVHLACRFLDPEVLIICCTLAGTEKLFGFSYHPFVVSMLLGWCRGESTHHTFSPTVASQQ